MTKSHSPRQLTRWLSWRAARWALLAAVVPVLWACNARRLAEPDPAPQQIFNDLFQQSVNRNLDIVFMVDDSLSMEPLQVKLTSQFPVFMDVLKNLPGGLPNIHIGVVSSSMGAGANGANISHCNDPGNDHGVFRTNKLGTTCAKATLNAGQNFIVNVNGQANYTGDIADVFSCIAALGQNGCGFEHQFESVLRALGADGAKGPAENVNFLRDDAYLAIVMITNEDDCSAPPNSDLFSTTTGTLSDPLGPLQSYRCNQYGHLCNGQQPPRSPATPMTLENCTSAEDGRLLRVKDVVAAMKGLKADPNKVLVAAIAGPPTPYVVDTYNDSTTSGETWPEVRHSCQQNKVGDMTYGDPAVRIKQWVDAFGANGVFETICKDDFRDSLQVIANKIGQKIGSPCVNGLVLDTKGDKWTMGDANPPDCAVVDHKSTTDGVVNSTLPHCDGNTAGATECWTLEAGGTTCPADSHIIKFNRPGAPATMELNSTVSCSVRTCPIGKTIQADGTCSK
jgi:hypothetical protein